MKPLPATLGLASFIAALALAQDKFAERRAAMVNEIRELTVTLQAETGIPKLDPRVLAAMERVPRHEFVPPGERERAYHNRPLPIAHGQTISQPYIVALMTHLMRIEPDDVVLEVGTGSGYQAAVLAELARHVYTIEIVEPLGKQAAQRLKALGYENITTRIGDGYQGWPSEAPFDAIMVTAAPDHVPRPLIEQLKNNGRMVLPVGGNFLSQQLVVVEKKPDGRIETRQVIPVRFVPLTGTR
ncbi:MAG TPA: protein-L-isoaspartate(D-aspartate) O-methyltransferase [Burkholderiales bacterium]|nr:protein-L-isoaspartate(D-aspartate) O-methyltransferase [Burkholderiales bacterium]